MHALSVYFLIFLLNFILILPNEHKFYVTTTNIQYKSEINTIQIISQLFIEDAELLLQQTNQNIRLDPDSKVQFIDSILEINLKKNLQFYFKDSLLTYSFLGKEYKNDVVLCYLELSQLKPLEKIRVRNTIFFNLFNDQKNIIHFKFKGIRKSFLLENKKPEVEIDITL
jgi:hypothetical protein